MTPVHDPMLILTLIFFGTCVMFWTWLRWLAQLVEGKRCPHCHMRLDRT